MELQEHSVTIDEFVITSPDVEHLITEDDTPVDNIFSEKQQRLLVELLHQSKPFGDRAFVSSTNVGIYYGIHLPAVVPDMLLSMDVHYAENVWEKRNRVYMLWELGKPPEVVVEIVSNAVGNEKGKKFDIYARMGVHYYIIMDPLLFLHKQKLNVYEFHAGGYHLKANNFLDTVGIEATLWQGVYEHTAEEWMRWKDQNGKLLPTGLEAIEAQSKLTLFEKQRAETEKQRADKLAEKLRLLGVNPDEVL
jgi:Uma2 family endonuclease